MNRINITNNEQTIPATTPNLKLLQDAILSLQQFSAMGSSGNFVLSGCVQTGQNVSAGYVVINGELLPFAGGTILPTVTVAQTAEDVNILGVNYPALRILRTAKFATGTGNNYYAWADFKRIKSLEQIENMLPKVYVQAAEPPAAKDGDFWIITN